MGVADMELMLIEESTPNSENRDLKFLVCLDDYVRTYKVAEYSAQFQAITTGNFHLLAEAQEISQHKLTVTTRFH